MNPSLKGKASAGAGAVDFRKPSLHANNLQEQLRQSACAFCRACQFKLNARRKSADRRTSANIHDEFSRLAINYLNNRRLS
jgi:hypothetical protein